MATEETPGPRAQRVRLGAELRRLRALAGMSGRELARRSRISQPQISRMERGEIPPSLPEVQRLIAALGLPKEHTRGLTRMAEDALNEYTLLKDWRRAGLAALQADIRTQELATRVLRDYSPYVIPGLLQTPDYARCLHELFSPSGGTAAAFIAGRLERQAILHDPSRRFEFIMTESALRWRPVNAAPPVLSAQYDRLTVIAALANVEIGIIPAGVPMHTWPTAEFIIYDERDEGYPPFVVIELPHEYRRAFEPADVALYRDKLAALRQSALSGAEAVDFISHQRNQVMEDNPQ
jgi:transcriptional regulator with XRE-family HTH domain